MRPVLIVTTVGISLITNHLSVAERADFVQRFNQTAAHPLSRADQQRLRAVVAALRARLLAASDAETARLSAELNSLLRWRQRSQRPRSELHILVGSDTLLGRAAVELVAAWLEERAPRTAAAPGRAGLRRHR